MSNDQTTKYDTDILSWSEHHAVLLRRLAAGEQINDQVDWPNIIVEIEAVGRSELHAVESLLTLALVHMLKAKAWPLSSEVPGWQAEARLLRRQARRRFVPSMRQKIDVASLYADALYALPETIDGQPPGPVAQDCTLTLDRLLHLTGFPAIRELRKRQADAAENPSVMPP